MSVTRRRPPTAEIETKRCAVYTRKSTSVGLEQEFNSTLLAPDLQEKILFLEAVNGVEPLSERALRKAVRARSWVEQRARFSEVAKARRKQASHNSPAVSIRRLPGLSLILTRRAVSFIP